MTHYLAVLVRIGLINAFFLVVFFPADRLTHLNAPVVLVAKLVRHQCHGCNKTDPWFH